jgi:hypothetical protein
MWWSQIRTGVFSPSNSAEYTIDRHTGGFKEKVTVTDRDRDRDRDTNRDTNTGIGGVSEGEGPPGKPQKKKVGRRRSLAQFDDVNEAIASCGVTVTESIDLALNSNERCSDVSKDATECSKEGTEGTAHSEDLDFDLAIEKQVTQ